MDALCRGLADAMLTVRDEGGQQVFPTGGVRVLAYAAGHHAVADGKHDYAFIYMNLRMGRGRSAAVKQLAGDTILAAAKGKAGGAVHCRPVHGPDRAGGRRRGSLRRETQHHSPPFQESLMSLPAATTKSLARQLYEARKQRVPLRHFSQQHQG
jgi:5-carboxymethyl-2-hydroxymuconate isomerase